MISAVLRYTKGSHLEGSHKRPLPLVFHFLFVLTKGKGTQFVPRTILGIKRSFYNPHPPFWKSRFIEACRIAVKGETNEKEMPFECVLQFANGKKKTLMICAFQTKRTRPTDRLWLTEKLLYPKPSKNKVASTLIRQRACWMRCFSKNMNVHVYNLILQFGRDCYSHLILSVVGRRNGRNH